MTSVDNTIIHAQIEVSHCTAELSLNGVPVTRIVWSPTRIPIENVAVDHILIPGTNTLELLVEPGPSPSSARTTMRELAFTSMGASARLIAFPAGVPGLKEYGEVLEELVFRWDNASPARQVFPQSLLCHVSMGAASGRWGWQDAPALILDDALRREAAAVLDSVEQAIRSHDVDGFWRLTELQVKDVSRAYRAITETGLRMELASMFSRFQDAPEPVMGRDPSAHDFRLVARGKLLQCIDRDWSTAFKLRDPDDGSAIPYSIFLARIDGALRIVR